MSYGVQSETVHKKLRLDKRKHSSNWYARLTLDNGKRIVRSTKTDDFEDAKERAIEIYYETQARIKKQSSRPDPQVQTRSGAHDPQDGAGVTSGSRQASLYRLHFSAKALAYPLLCQCRCGQN